MKRWLVLLMIACACTATACGGDDDDDGTGDDDDDDGDDTAAPLDCATNAPTYDDVSAFDKCVMCHSSELAGPARMGSPGNINFDMASTAKTASAEAAKEVRQGAMPPKSSKITITDAQKQKLYDWVECGSKE